MILSECIDDDNDCADMASAVAAAWNARRNHQSSRRSVILFSPDSASPRRDSRAVNVSANHKKDRPSTICSQCPSISWLARVLKSVGPSVWPGTRPPTTYETFAVLQLLGHSRQSTSAAGCGSIIAHQSSAQSTIVHLIDCCPHSRVMPTPLGQ